ncbi:Sensor histidine kinase WalK [compost metagenome]
MSSSAHNIVIEISDRGPGIPEASLDQVFMPFFRLESSRNRDTGGVGLGLSSARSAVREQGGELLLSNRQGGGLVARIELPR